MPPHHGAPPTTEHPPARGSLLPSNRNRPEATPTSSRRRFGIPGTASHPSGGALVHFRRTPEEETPDHAHHPGRHRPRPCRRACRGLLRGRRRVAVRRPPPSAPHGGPRHRAPATGAPATEAPSVEPSPSADACATDTLAVKTPGTFTIGADNPAFPPYFATREGGNTPPWEDSDFTGDPTTGEGFEGAVAFAIAEQLGFAADAVTWIPVPFNNSFAPGAKDFDIYLTQVSSTPERAQAADLSDGYYDVTQSVVALKDSPSRP